MRQKNVAESISDTFARVTVGMVGNKLPHPHTPPRVKSILRYPGGKNRAVKQILQYSPMD